MTATNTSSSFITVLIKSVLVYSVTVFLIGCQGSSSNKNIAEELEDSKWAVIRGLDSVKLDYQEIVFLRTGWARIQSENLGQQGPLTYSIQDGQVAIGNELFNVVEFSGYRLDLQNSSDYLILYRVPEFRTKVDSNQIDPFYLRRCYFMLHENEITIDSAIEYLIQANQPIWDTILVEESL